LAVDSVNGQPLSIANAHEPRITLYKKSGESTTYDPASTGENNAHIMSSVPVVAYGDTKIDVSMYGKDNSGISILYYI